MTEFGVEGAVAEGAGHRQIDTGRDEEHLEHDGEGRAGRHQQDSPGDDRCYTDEILAARSGGAILMLGRRHRRLAVAGNDAALVPVLSCGCVDVVIWLPPGRGEVGRWNAVADDGFGCG